LIHALPPANQTLSEELQPIVIGQPRKRLVPARPDITPPSPDGSSAYTTFHSESPTRPAKSKISRLRNISERITSPDVSAKTTAA
jgi:hypothetical protein